MCADPLPPSLPLLTHLKSTRSLSHTYKGKGKGGVHTHTFAFAFAFTQSTGREENVRGKASEWKTSAEKRGEAKKKKIMPKRKWPSLQAKK